MKIKEFFLFLNGCFGLLLFAILICDLLIHHFSEGVYGIFLGLWLGAIMFLPWNDK